MPGASVTAGDQRSEPHLCRECQRLIPCSRHARLDAQQTPMGVISLRRRHDPVSDQVVYEAKLDDEFLMSSLFTAANVPEDKLITLD